jgi:hypothetical protein
MNLIIKKKLKILPHLKCFWLFFIVPFESLDGTILGIRAT